MTTRAGAVPIDQFPNIPTLPWPGDPAAGNLQTSPTTGVAGALFGSSSGAKTETFAQRVAAHPLVGFAVAAVALLALASIPATAKAAVWAAAAILLLQQLTIHQKRS